MTVFVDSLQDWGWKLRGRRTQSCHMFTDSLGLAELHRMAEAIGMKRSWFQDGRAAPHYDLVPSRRAAAVALGAVELDRHASVAVWKARRALVAQAAPAMQATQPAQLSHPSPEAPVSAVSLPSSPGAESPASPASSSNQTQEPSC